MRHANAHSDRYHKQVKDFAALLFLFGARRVYQFVRYTLLQAAIPSLATTRRHIAGIVPAPLLNPGVSCSRIKGAKHFFEAVGYKCPFYVICSDAVSCVPILWYRCADGALLGFAVSDKDLPRVLIFPPTTMKELQEIMLKYPLATQVDAWLLAPLDPSKPAFVIAVFPQIQSPPANEIHWRLELISKLLEVVGIYVMAYCSDGAAPQLRAMKIREGVRFFARFFLLCF